MNEEDMRTLGVTLQYEGGFHEVDRRIIEELYQEVLRLQGGGWVKIGERLPADRQDCLVYAAPLAGWLVPTAQARFYVDMHDRYPYRDTPREPGFDMLDYVDFTPLSQGKITHWQPLPEPPR